MDVFSLAASITLDTSDYEKGLNSAQKSMSVSKSEVMKLANVYKQQGMSMSDAMKRAYSEIGKDAEKATQSNKENEKSIGGVGSAADTFKNKLGVLSAQYQKALAEVNRLTEAFNKSVKETGEASEETQKLAEELSKAEKDTAGLKKQMDDMVTPTNQAADAVEDVGEEAKEAGGKFEGFGNKLKSFLGTLAKVGAAALGAATAAVTAFGVSSVKTGAEFDSSMSQVAATMGTTVDNIQELRDFAMDMGSKTAFSAVQAADALNYMALAGYDADEAMQALPNVLNLAAAGNIDLAYASDMVTDAQSALGLSMEESAELVDKMAMASSKSNTSVSQLGEAILTVGGTAKNLAGGTTELSTALGILADNGIKGSEGGTTLRNVILSLAAPTDQAAELMESLGLEVYDAEGKMRPLNETFGDLDAILSTMTQGEQTEVLNTIFNKVDLKGVNALLANTGERFDELSGYIDNAAGSAEQMAAVQLDNLEGDITLFKSALEGAQIVISDKLTPSLRDFVQFGSTAVSTLSTAFQEGGLSGAMEALGTILSDGLNMVVEKLPDMVDAGMQLVGALGQGLLDNSEKIIDAGFEIVSTLLDGIVKALPEIGNGAVKIVTELGEKLGDNLPTLIPKAVEGILEFAEALTSPESINGLLDAAVDIINGLLDGIMAAMPLVMENAPQIISNIVAGLINAVPRLLEIGGKLVEFIIQGFIYQVKMIPQVLQGIWDGIVEGLKSIFGEEKVNSVFEGFANVWASISNAAASAWGAIQSAWGAVVDFFSGIWEGIKEAFTPVAEVLGGFFSSAWDIIKAVWDAAVGFFSGIWEGIKAVFSAVAIILGAFFSAAWDIIKGVWNKAVGFFSGVWKGIKEVFSPVAEALGNFFSSAWDAVKGVWDAAVEFFTGVWDGIKGVFSAAANWFGNIFRNAWSNIKNAFANVGQFFSGVWNTISGTFTGLVSSAAQWGRDLIDNFVGGITEFAHKVADAVSGVAGTVKDFLGFSEPEKGPLSNFHTYAPDMMKLFAQGITDNADLLKTAFNNSLDFAEGFPAADMDYSAPVGHYSTVSSASGSGYAEGGVVVNQTIYAAEQSPIELAANTRAAFQRARWAIG